MAKFWESLSEENKEKLAQCYKQLTGKKWIPPKRDKQDINCEVKLESTKEIARLMQEKPSPMRRR